MVLVLHETTKQDFGLPDFQSAATPRNKKANHVGNGTQLAHCISSSVVETAFTVSSPSASPLWSTWGNFSGRIPSSEELVQAGMPGCKGLQGLHAKATCCSSHADSRGCMSQNKGMLRKKTHGSIAKITRWLSAPESRAISPQGVVGIVIAPCYGVPARDFGAIQALCCKNFVSCKSRASACLIFALLSRLSAKRRAFGCARTAT